MGVTLLIFGETMDMFLVGWVLAVLSLIYVLWLYGLMMKARRELDDLDRRFLAESTEEDRERRLVFVNRLRRSHGMREIR